MCLRVSYTFLYVFMRFARISMHPDSFSMRCCLFVFVSMRCCAFLIFGNQEIKSFWKSGPHMAPLAKVVRAKWPYIEPLVMRFSSTTSLWHVFTMRIPIFHEKTLFHVEPSEVFFGGILCSQKKSFKWCLLIQVDPDATQVIQARSTRVDPHCALDVDIQT